jgi:glycosyltransferase involved in cell wall biosynthesis
MILTIGIPTFNSVKTLCETLKSIEDQTLRLDEHGVEILISDNGSSVDISEALKSRFDSKFYKSLVFNLNATNLGYDLNLTQIMKKASGSYVKLLADDDVLRVNYIEELLHTINSQNFDVIVNNFAFYNSDLSVIKKYTWFAEDFRFQLERSVKFLDSIGHAYGQISSLTFKKDLVLNLPPLKFQSNYIHVYWFFSLFEKFHIKFENKVLLNVREGSPNFSGDGFVDKITPLGGIKALQAAKFISKPLRNQLIHKQKIYCLTRLSSISDQSFFTRKLIAQKFLPFYRFVPAFWLFWLPFVLMPTSWRIFLKKLRKNLRTTKVG